jgi:hypothetical protein
MLDVLETLNAVGMRIEYRPSGLIIPIEDDQCDMFTCEGVIVEIAQDCDLYSTDYIRTYRIEWDVCCPMHAEPTEGHMTREMWAEYERAYEARRNYLIGVGSDIADIHHLADENDPYRNEPGQTWEYAFDVVVIGLIGQIN